MYGQHEEAYFTVVLGTSMLLFFVALFFFAILQYQKKQLKNRFDQSQLQKRYEREIQEVQIEIQNQTLQRVGQDLHDNIGQLMILAKMQLGMLEEIATDQEVLERIGQTYNVVGEALSELRSLTKSLDGDFVKNFGLVDSLEHELQRLQKALRIQTELTVSDPVYSIGFQREIVLFRVVQELLNNAIKHAKATKFTVTVHWQPEQLELTVEDNGMGFDYDAVMNRPMSQSGAGLRNIHNRLELIGGTVHIITAPGAGVRTEIVVDTKE